MFETETVGPCLVSEIEVGEGGDHGPFAPSHFQWLRP